MTKIELKSNPQKKINITSTSTTIDGNTIEINLLNPEQPSPEAANLIKVIGLEAYNAILTREYIKREIGLENNLPPHVIFQLIKGFIGTFITHDPNQLHWDTVRSAMEADFPDLLNEGIAI